MDQQNQQPEPKKKSRKWLWILGGIIILIIIVAVAGGGSDSETTTNTSSQNNNEEVKTYSKNETFKVGDVQWELIDARDRGNTLKASESRYASIASDKTTTGKFIEITVEVENFGTDMKSVTNLTLIDDKNREFTSSSDTSEWVPEGKELFLLSNLYPNVPQQFIDIYEVPADATGLKVMVGDLDLFSGDEALIGLGV